MFNIVVDTLAHRLSFGVLTVVQYVHMFGGF